VRAVAGAAPEAIVIACTNLRAAPLVAALEREIDIPIYDSLAAVVWQSLRLAGVDPRPVRGFGRLFEISPGGPG
jgi:maleate isomerase